MKSWQEPFIACGWNPAPPPRDAHWGETAPITYPSKTDGETIPGPRGEREHERHNKKPGALKRLVRAGGLAFVGMGLFTWNMGRDMGNMTVSVLQMGKDVTRMAHNEQKMAGMSARIQNRSVDMNRMNHFMGTMAHMANDIDRFAQPQRLMPFAP